MPKKVIAKKRSFQDKALQEMHVTAKEIYHQVCDNIVEEIINVIRYPDLYKSFCDLEGLVKARSHKYIKRTGTPGHYRYWYKDANGRLYIGNNAPEGHPHHDKTLPKHDFNPKPSQYVPDIKKITVVPKGSPIKPAATGTKHIKVIPKHQPIQEPATDATVPVAPGAIPELPKQKAQYTITEDNKHLAEVSDAVLNEFTNRTKNFKEITKGEMGFKGIVTHEGKNYFVKDATSDPSQKKTSNKVAEREETDNELNYSFVVQSAFSDLKNHFTNKYRLSDTIFMADAVNLLDHSIIEEDNKIRIVNQAIADRFYNIRNYIPETIPEYEQKIKDDFQLTDQEMNDARAGKQLPVSEGLAKATEKMLAQQSSSFKDEQRTFRIKDYIAKPGNKEKLSKLGIINYVMGNRDRHGNNWSFDDKGEFRLFDEGLALYSQQSHAIAQKYMVDYMTRFYEEEVSSKEMLDYFSEDRKKTVEDAMLKQYVPLDKVEAFKERWDLITKYFKSRNKVRIGDLNKMMMEFGIKKDKERGI